MKDQLINPINTAIRFGLVGLAFLTPLFFLPITSEFYQFNKQALLLVVTSILLILWGVKMGLEGKMRIVRTPLDLPLLLLALAFILATIFSADRYISIAGFYPRFHGSLVSMLAYVILYFVAVSNLDKKAREWLVTAFVASGVVAAILGVMSFFGISIPLLGKYAQVRTWTPLGNIASLSLYLALVVPVALGAMMNAKNKGLQPLYLIASIIMILPIFLYGLVGPILALILGLGATAIFLAKVKTTKQSKSLMGVFAIATVIIMAITLIGGLENVFIKPLVGNKTVNVAADKTLPLVSAWRISTQAVGQRPFFGVGPSTFAYSFTALKGPEMNGDDYWNLRFDLSGNEYLTMLSTIGIVGIISLVLVLLIFSRSLLTFTYKSHDVAENPMSVFLIGSLVAFLIGIFFQDTTTPIWTFFILFAAVSFSYLKDWGAKGTEEVDVKLVALTSGGVQFAPAGGRNADSSIGTAVTILGVIAFLTILYFGLPTYQAEAAYQKALVASAANKANDTRNSLLDAIRINPNRDTYRRSLLVLDRLIATNLSQKEEKTDEDNKNIAGLVNEAISQGNRVTGYIGNGLNSFTIRRDAGTSPLNVANWEALSGVLASLNLEGDNKTINAANSINVAAQAVALDPRNPVLLESLGNIYLNNNLVDNAIQAYQQAVVNRPSYTSARYNLANALKKKGGNDEQVVLQLQTVLDQLPKDSKDRERVQQELSAAQKASSVSANKK